MSQRPSDRPAFPFRDLTPPLPERPKGDPNQPTPAVPRVRVILHRAAGRDLMFIVRTVMELTRFGRAEATHKMWETHHFGRSQLLVTHRERAELYIEQLAGRGLPATIESA